MLERCPARRLPICKLSLIVPLTMALVAAGCDKIQLPQMDQSSTATPAPAPVTPVGQAQPNPAAVTPPPEQFKPDPKQVVAAFKEKSRIVGQLQDQDILSVTELTEGLEDVTELKAMGMHITDNGVKRLARFPNLESVDLSSSMVTAEGLSVIKEMPQLKKLILNSTSINDTSMQLIGELPNLTELSLVKTSVTDFGLSLLGDLEQLESLDISYTQITGAGFEKFRDNKKLRVLRAAHSAIQNGAFKFLAKCPIEELDIDVTSIGDPGMLFIGKMTKMKRLTCEFCSISDLSIRKMSTMKDLEYVSFRNNGNISAMLFEKLKNSKKLKYVNVVGLRITPTQCAMLMKLIPGCQVAS